jgi:iron(III) transport system substrate-binding protein
MPIKSLNTALRRIGAVAIAGLAAAALTGAAQAKTELLVYTAVEADELAKFKAAFEKANPDVEIKWVRDSTGIIAAKLMAEKDNPKADIVWGVAVTSLIQLAQEKYFQPYAPKGIDKIPAQYKDKANPPLWVGQRAYLAAICFNTVEAQKKNLPKPASWKDLLKPAYKDQVIMPNPNSSGTGFLDVSSWIQMWGEKDAWTYMDGLHQNIARYTHSGSAPCKQAAAGEIPIGVSFAYRGFKSKAEGAPLEIIAPAEGLGWDLEAFAIVRNTKNLDAAKKLADWSVSKEAADLYIDGYEVTAYPGIVGKYQQEQAPFVKAMIKNDFNWAGRARLKILDEWAKRYDAKSEPKKK